MKPSIALPPNSIIVAPMLLYAAQLQLIFLSVNVSSRLSYISNPTVQFVVQQAKPSNTCLSHRRQGLPHQGIYPIWKYLMCSYASLPDSNVSIHFQQKCWLQWAHIICMHPWLIWIEQRHLGQSLTPLFSFHARKAESSCASRAWLLSHETVGWISVSQSRQILMWHMLQSKMLETLSLGTSLDATFVWSFEVTFLITWGQSGMGQYLKLAELCCIYILRDDLRSVSNPSGPRCSDSSCKVSSLSQITPLPKTPILLHFRGGSAALHICSKQSGQYWWPHLSFLASFSVSPQLAQRLRSASEIIPCLMLLDFVLPSPFEPPYLAQNDGLIYVATWNSGGLAVCTTGSM